MFALNMEIMLQHVTYVFIKVRNSLERHNIITCFDTKKNLNDIRIMLVFGTVEVSAKFTF